MILSVVHVLLCVLAAASGEHGFLFDRPDLSVIAGKVFRVEAFPAAQNDAILKKLDGATPSRLKSLKWASFGRPGLVTNAVSENKLFHFSPNLVTMHVSLLNPRIRKCLAQNARRKHGISVTSDQISIVPLSHVDCTLSFKDQHSKTFQLRASALPTDLQENPIPISFYILNPEKSALEQRLKFTESDEKTPIVHCKFFVSDFNLEFNMSTASPAEQSCMISPSDEISLALQEELDQHKEQTAEKEETLSNMMNQILVQLATMERKLQEKDQIIRRLITQFEQLSGNMASIEKSLRNEMKGNVGLKVDPGRSGLLGLSGQHGAHGEALTEEEKDLIHKWSGSTFETYCSGSEWRKGSTILHYVSYEGRIDAVRALLRRGDNVDASRDDGRTPLHVASQSGHADVITLLIENGADVNYKAKDGRTPLHMASQCCKWHDHSGRVTAEEEDSSCIDVIKVLLLNKADKSIKNKIGKTPIDVAITAEARQLLSE